MITLCLTYFRSLSLANLCAALYSVSRQDFSRVASLVVIDNNTDDTREALEARLIEHDIPVPIIFRSFKHGQADRMHAWSTNQAVKEAATPWVFFTRADYLLSFSAVAKFAEVLDHQPADWDGFVTSSGRHLHQDVQSCETSSWRREGPGIFPGIDFTYTCIDAGVWMARRSTFEKVGGLNERLSHWGHAQTHFQYKLHSAGTECVRINETLFFHPAHGATRDLALANEDLVREGISAHELWQRYEGPNPY